MDVLSAQESLVLILVKMWFEAAEEVKGPDELVA